MSELVFRLPDLGEGLTEAEVIEWQVAVGDTVAVDQHVVVVETAKATVEVPCPYGGRVLTLHGTAGQSVEVGSPLLTVSSQIDPPTNDSPTPPPKSEADQYREEEQAGSGAVLVGYGTGSGNRRRRHRTAPAGAGTTDSRTEGPPDTSPSDQIAAPAQTVRVISPIVRRMARERGVDLHLIEPTGAGGVVRRRDVEAAGEVQARGDRRVDGATPTDIDGAAATPVDAADQRIPLTGVLGTMAERLTRSRRLIPDATTWVDADATALLEAKSVLTAAKPDAHIGLLALFGRIVLAGLRAFPELNASVDDEAREIVRHRAVNLGFAAQSPRGLLVPVVHDAGAMTTTELAGALGELIALARAGRLSPAQMSGGTFTLNNYGVFGVDGSAPIINHPEAAMLGVGRIIDRPWAHDGAVALRKVTQLSFTFDHRVCDGGVAGGFLRFVADSVESPTRLLADL